MDHTESAARVVLGVGGGIAAYKSASLLRLLVKAGHDVTVIPTPSSEQFVGKATWEALSGNSVSTTVFDGIPEVRHVRLGQEADLVIVAPATADLLARAASGQADNLLLATLLVAQCPIIFAPAMHTQMWEHPATQANVQVLRERGCIVIDPAVGQLTGTDSGTGRLPEPEELAQLVESHLEQPAVLDLSGCKVVISAGGTQEPVDPVRFLGNRSSGLQGCALAAVARDRGADVVLVAAALSVPIPSGIRVVNVRTAHELHAAMVAEAALADVVVMAAAVADYRPEVVRDTKIKKDTHARLTLNLTQNPDILVELVQTRPAGQLVVGFAAETGEPGRDVLALGRLKAARKGVDYLVVNDVSGGQVFGQVENSVVVIDAFGAVHAESSGTKTQVAHSVWNVVAARLAQLHDSEGHTGLS